MLGYKIDATAFPGVHSLSHLFGPCSAADRAPFIADFRLSIDNEYFVIVCIVSMFLFSHVDIVLVFC